jgi:hypothetical protein
MTDILRQLQRAAFGRGRDDGGSGQIEFPVSQREFGFTQEQAAHRFIFRDNELIESLGRRNPTWRYTIPFREDITIGGWEHLFVDVYPDFLAACQDRSRGVLTDPVHGSKPAKCVSLREILDVNKRDGIDVEVEFIYAPRETDFSQDLGSVIRTLQGYASYARRFDNELAAAVGTARDAAGNVRSLQDLQPAGPVMSPLDAISAVGGQVLLAQSKVDAALADSAFRLEKSVETLDRLQNPSFASTRTQARRLQAAALDLEERVDVTGARPLARIQTTEDIAVAALAKKLGVTLEQLLSWNHWMSKSPMVKANSNVRVLRDSLASAGTNGRRRAG